MRQRVICVMARLLDQDDGLGVYGQQLLEGMMKLDPESRYVILLRSDRHARMFDDFPNAEVQVMPTFSKTWWDQFLVPWAARKVKADIIFNPKFSLPFFTRRPTAMVLHGSDWFVNPGNYKWWDNIYIRVILPMYCRKAKKLAAVSDVIIRDLVKFIGLDDSKVTATYAAPAPHFKKIEDRGRLEEFAKKYGLPERFILTVGRVYHTGHDNLDEYPGGNNENLIRGYRRYREMGGGLPLVVAGRDIELYLRNHGFTDGDLENVYFTGFIPNADIVCAYNLAELFILVTLYESFCLPMFEAFATECPAVVPNTGACPEVGADAAYYVDPLDVRSIAEGMLKVAGSPETRQAMIEKGVKRAGMFTWEQTARKTLDVLEEVAPSTNSSRKDASLSGYAIR